jgi:hypothetical protein
MMSTSPADFNAQIIKSSAPTKDVSAECSTAEGWAHHPSDRLDHNRRSAMVDEPVDQAAVALSCWRRFRLRAALA